VLKSSASHSFYASGKLPEMLSVNDWFFGVNTFLIWYVYCFKG